MDPPVIQHSSECLCHFCLPQRDFTHTSGSPGAHALARRAAANARQADTFDLNYVVLVACVSLILGVAVASYYSSGGQQGDSQVTIYRQDLNSVEMIIHPGSPIDPEVIKAIHHFQELPFGDKPDTVGMVLVRKLEKVFVFVFVLVLLYCYFRFC